jgi:hypothetical protein
LAQIDVDRIAAGRVGEQEPIALKRPLSTRLVKRTKRSQAVSPNQKKGEPSDLTRLRPSALICNCHPETPTSSSPLTHGSIAFRDPIIAHSRFEAKRCPALAHQTQNSQERPTIPYVDAGNAQAPGADIPQARTFDTTRRIAILSPASNRQHAPYAEQERVCQDEPTVPPHS